MGNCVEAMSCRAQEEEEKAEKTERSEETDEKGDDGRMRIKVVMTKEELQWLMQQIQDDSQGKGLQQLLTELNDLHLLHRDTRFTTKLALLNSTSSNWKPSLECIMESPEVPDQMQR